MKKFNVRTTRIVGGVIAGLVVLAGAIWVLSRTLGNYGPNYSPTLYEGRTIDYWVSQANSGNETSSNQAQRVIAEVILPRLTDQMFHDTNDSWIRMNLVEILNGLPMITIYYGTAPERRVEAASDIGQLGELAKKAIPDLVKVLESPDQAVHEKAIEALGEIHGDPGVVIPILTKFLDDDDLDDEAALALAQYGSLAESAVPKIIPLLHAPDDDAQAAAVTALKAIDPVAYQNATNSTSDVKP